MGILKRVLFILVYVVQALQVQVYNLYYTELDEEVRILGDWQLYLRAFLFVKLDLH